LDILAVDLAAGSLGLADTAANLTAKMI